MIIPPVRLLSRIMPGARTSDKRSIAGFGGADEREHPDDGAELHHASQDECIIERGAKKSDDRKRQRNHTGPQSHGSPPTGQATNRETATHLTRARTRAAKIGSTRLGPVRRGIALSPKSDQ